MSHPAVAITIVTHNSARYICHCLNTLREVAPDLPIVVVDNASTDGTQELLRTFGAAITLVENKINNGFAGGQNQAIKMTSTPWVLVLNADVRVTPGFVEALVAAGEKDSLIGTVCGKLLALQPDFTIPKDRLIDSTGIYFTPELRHFDRGSREPDAGQYDRNEYVFGATGAAALYRRAMIRDVSVSGEFFDEDFFAYREDADVAWRSQLLGWHCLYTPGAVAYHVRTVLPTNRQSVSAAVNYHSVKNRFLMRIKNADARLLTQHGFAILWRDLLVVTGCLLRERSSLPAFGFVFSNWGKIWAKRRAIQSRRRTSPAEIARWFDYRPVSAAIPAVICASPC